MEKLRHPNEDPRILPPDFVCSSIQDLLDSRDEIIETVESWRRIQAARMLRLIYTFMSFGASPGNLLRRAGNRSTLALVTLPRVRHFPADDKEFELSPDEITIRDGISILVIKLPSPNGLVSLNANLVTKKQAPLSLDHLRSGWTGDVFLQAVYPKSEVDRYTIVGVTNLQLPKQVPQRNFAPNNSFLPQPI